MAHALREGRPGPDRGAGEQQAEAAGQAGRVRGDGGQHKREAGHAGAESGSAPGNTVWNIIPTTSMYSIYLTLKGTMFTLDHKGMMGWY